MGLFIDPGTDDELPQRRGWRPRPTNRSVEYDTVNDDYARFLLQDVLPAV